MFVILQRPIEFEFILGKLWWPVNVHISRKSYVPVLWRVLAEIYDEVLGNGAMIRDLGGRLVSEDILHGQPRRLYDVDLGRRIPNSFIMLVNGT